MSKASRIRSGTDLRGASYDFRRRMLTARHEAGHALLHCLLDIPFLNVEILRPISAIRLDDSVANSGFVRCHGGICMGCVRQDLERIIRENKQNGFDSALSVLISMAGIAGEQVHLGRPRWKFVEDWVQGAGGPDYEDASEIAERNFLSRVYAKGDTQAYLCSLFFSSWKVLRRNLGMHGALTQALIEKCILTYDECVSITNIRHEDVDMAEMICTPRQHVEVRRNRKRRA